MASATARSRRTPPQAPRGRHVGGRLLLAGVLLAALNLRPALASVSPLLDSIRADVHLSRSVAGLLTTIPTLCIGLGAFLVPRLARRLGSERALTAAIALIGVATVARLAAGHAAVLFATTVLVGAGIAVGQTLLPSLVRTRFAEHPMLVTSLYTVGMAVGAAVPAALAAPLSQATGSWPLGLGAWSLFAVGATVVLLPIARRTASRPDAGPVAVAPPWRERRAWEVSLFFGGSSGLYFVILAWLAPVYEDHGWSATRAGLLLTVFTVAQPLATLILAWRGRRFRDRRLLLIGSLAVIAVGLLGVALSPYSLPVVWAILLGAGNGILFPVMLVLPVDYASDGPGAARLAGMGFGIGYLLASLGPVLAGWLRDATGTYTAPFAAYAGVCALLMLLARRFVPPPKLPAVI